MKPFKLHESLSVIIPAYNEEGNLIKLVRETVRDARKTTADFEVIIINDGSLDNTGVLADKLEKSYKEVRVIHHPRNLGLAVAWKTGINACHKTLILYIEGDGQQPFNDQLDLLKKLNTGDLVLGVRSKRCDYTFFRKMLSYGYLFLIWLFFGLSYRDVGWSQAYRREIFKKIKIKSTSPFFDTEVVIKAKRLGYRIAEARVYYHPRKAGTTSLGNLKTASKMLIEIIKMRLGLLI